MAQEMEMTVLPADDKHVLVEDRKQSSNARPDMERNLSITSDGRKRSKLQLFAILTALFLITRDLKSAAGYTWIGGAYLLANAVSGPIWAKLSDIWGRKPIILVALAVFFASSAVCATAKTMEALIIGRAFQGAAGGGLILGGYVVSRRGSWSRARWGVCKFGDVEMVINLPISAIAGLLIVLFLDIRHEHTSFADGIKAIDWFGIFTFLGFTLMLLLGLDFGGVLFPWDSPKVIALLVVGSVMIFAFIYTETKASYPLIPMALFRRRTNVAAFSLVFFHGFVFIAAEYYMPLYLQSVLEASPLRSGLLLLPFIVTGAVLGVLAGVWIHRTGEFRGIMWFGTFLLALGFGLFISFDAYTTVAKTVGYLMIGGAGSGILFEAPLIAVQSQVDQQEVASATATLSFIRNIALSISTIVGGTIFQNSMNNRASVLRAAGLPQELLELLDGESAMANVMIPGTLSNPAWELASKEAFAYAMRNMWILYTVLAFLSFVASLFIEAAHLGTDHVETVTGLRKEEPEVGR